MKQTFYKIANWLIVLILLGVLAYFFRTDLLNFKNRFYQQYYPCQEPITYQLGTFDQHFNISQKNFLAAVSEAEQILEKPIDLNLFKYSPSGTIKINLIYDYRQDATVKLRQLDIEVKDDQATYNKLKIKYTTLTKTNLIDKAKLDSKIAELDRLTAVYNAKVQSWNRRGGVPPAEIEQLQAQETALNQLLTELKTQQKLFNEQVDELNALANTLNRLAKTLNLSAEHYNTIGASRGSEFAEGTYVSSAGAQSINIYQYDDTRQLVRLLAHELGHALGLEHVSSTKAIMYYLNNGVNEKLTPADLVELKQHCNLK